MSLSLQSGVIITRPEPEASATAALLEQQGWTPVLAPMLRIERRNHALAEELTNVQAVIFTSAAAVRAAIEDLPPTLRRQLPALCVGDKTAKLAKAGGFASSLSANGNAEDLLEMILLGQQNKAISLAKSGQGSLFFYRGETIIRDLTSILRKYGYLVHEKVLYAAVLAESLPIAAQTALDQKTVQAALFLSQRAAEQFVRLTQGWDMTFIKAICLSARIAEALPKDRFQQITIAAQPRFDQLIKLLP